jgi:hypothetical protein
MMMADESTASARRAIETGEPVFLTFADGLEVSRVVASETATDPRSGGG